ncbi:MAG: hypothetical protein KY476_20790, partial [Planctomycetes bacterium]|nr:hypothetical protein [Planctomycetota bacterium]
MSGFVSSTSRRDGRELRVRHAAVLAGLLAVAAGTEVRAQEASGGSPAVRLTNPGRAAGLERYAAGRWASVAVELHNVSDREAEATAVMSFEGDPGVQFGRRVWLPPKARLVARYLARPPESLPPDARRVPFKALLYERRGTENVLVRDPSGEMLHSGLLPAGEMRTVTGFVGAAAEDQR